MSLLHTVVAQAGECADVVCENILPGECLLQTMALRYKAAMIPSRNLMFESLILTVFFISRFSQFHDLTVKPKRLHRGVSPDHTQTPLLVLLNQQLCPTPRQAVLGQHGRDLH